MAPHGKELSQDLKDVIVKLYKEQKSQREIAKLVNKSSSTIQKIIEKYNKEGNTSNRKRTGRPNIFNDREKRIITRKIEVNPKMSAPKIKAEIEKESGKTCNPQTIRRVLYNSGYHGRNIRKKPFVNSTNRRKRLDFVGEYENKDENFWKSVIFSDESKYNIFGSDGCQKVWRKVNTELDPKNMAATVKHGGGSVMVWGCIAASGVGNLVIIEEIMDKMVYLSILKNNLHQSAAKLGLQGSFVFQQDNDPKHTAHIVREWLLYNTPKQLKTPPQSPDLNPIEHLWDYLEKKIRSHSITSKDTLKAALIEEWNKIPPSVTQNLIASMPSRLKSVKKAKGYPTKY